MTSFNRAFAIAPSDSLDLQLNGALVDAFYVGGAGTIVLTMQDNSDVTFTAVAGGIIPVRAKRVKSTGTTATGIVALEMV